MSAATMLREIAQRNAIGEIVTLRWNPATDVLSLTVHRELDDCELVTADIPDVPKDRALDVFEHPYAYAWRIGTVTLPEREAFYATTEDEYPTDADDDAGEADDFQDSPGFSERA